jgi:hypothetical protein
VLFRRAITFADETERGNHFSLPSALLSAMNAVRAFVLSTVPEVPI